MVLISSRLDIGIVIYNPTMAHIRISSDFVVSRAICLLSKESCQTSSKQI